MGLSPLSRRDRQEYNRTMDDASIPRPRPPLAKVVERREGFGALLVAAARDARAAEGLAAAYAALAPAARSELLDAVVADARQEGISPAPVLASLLGVEPDARLTAAIAGALVASDTRALGRRTGARALFGGDAICGAALFALPLYGEFVEVITLAWNRAGLAHAHVVPLVRDDAAEGETFRLPPELRVVPTTVEEALDITRAALWRHRRLHGRLPETLDRFVDAFAG